MSTNCIQCIQNKRTGGDLLCDDCRLKRYDEKFCEAVKKHFANLTDEQRLDFVSSIMENYCIHCGGPSGGPSQICQCWNEE